MAAEEQPELEVEESGGGKKKLIIIIAVVLVVVLGAGGFFLMSGGDDAASEEVSLDETPAAQSAGSGASVELGDAMYVAMPRPFVFNVPGANRDRLVQIKVQLLVRGAQNEETAKKHIPLIEGTLLRVFSGTSADELGTSAGKDALKKNALKAVQDELLSIAGRTVVESVLFTGFVMQ
ncbi:flagellar basal body-associated protein FliL [Catenovulum agarivorans DS-2]|uniref:Flagellar protein FliL n=1 Tax=Catenovulum agarivorans DS-2 TaxID=1328313 RepID=W7QWT8_9ALTE|nr:flagellar basal body-associated protein FliL [Catenovulum agarivorans]EWH09730.1 flagellar basal body-associated protein FliL [Catenovulum agarivorans DS-2]